MEYRTIFEYRTGFLSKRYLVLTINISESLHSRFSQFVSWAIDIIKKFISKNAILAHYQVTDLKITLCDTGTFNQELGSYDASAYTKSDTSEVFIDLEKDIINKNGQLVLDKRRLVESLAHEFTHIQMHYKNQRLALRKAAISRLEHTTQKLQAELNTASPVYTKIRLAIFGFLNLLLSEGLAEFCGGEYKLSKKVFVKLYRTAQKEAYFYLDEKELYSALRLMPGVLYPETKNIAIQFKYFKSAPYPIGLHMVYTMQTCLPNIKLERILEMSPYEFVKLYETACGVARIRPVISLNSGLGYFDYNRFIQNLYKIFSEKRESGAGYFKICSDCKTKNAYYAITCVSCGRKFAYDTISGMGDYASAVPIIERIRRELVYLAEEYETELGPEIIFLWDAAKKLNDLENKLRYGTKPEHRRFLGNLKALKNINVKLLKLEEVVRTKLQIKELETVRERITQIINTLKDLPKPMRNRLVRICTLLKYLERRMISEGIKT